MRRSFIPVVLAAGLLAGSASSAPAPGPGRGGDEPRPEVLRTYKADLLSATLELLGDADFRELAASRLKGDGESVPFATLLRDYRETWPATANGAVAARIDALDAALRRAKGIEAYSKGILELRLVSPCAPSRADFEDVLVAVEPEGQERSWSAIPAVSVSGRRATLGVWEKPAVPVLVPGVSDREDLAAGVAYLNDGLKAAGFAAAATGTGQCTKLTRAWVDEDEEPWIKGAAETYALVSGIDPSVAKPVISVVDMPWWDYDLKAYYPNQIVIFWDGYRWGAANINLYEHDDGTNYQTVLNGILQAVTQAMNLAGAGAYSWIPQVANAIIQAMPAEWFTDDDDYVDVFYTVEKGRYYSWLYGASGNAHINLAPYTLPVN